MRRLLMATTVVVLLLPVLGCMSQDSADASKSDASEFEASGSPDQLIVGTWAAADTSDEEGNHILRVEFYEDGTVVSVSQWCNEYALIGDDSKCQEPTSVAGSYSWVTEDKVKVGSGMAGELVTVSNISRDQLRLTFPTGEAWEGRRVE